MKTYQLRTFHFRNSEALKALSESWFEYVLHMELAGVETHGIFRSPLRPNTIVILVSFEGDEPAELDSHACSELLAGLAGLDVKQIIRSDDLPLIPIFGKYESLPS